MEKKRMNKVFFISIFFFVSIVFALPSVSAANYSIGKYVRDASNVTLYAGWNMFALTMELGDNDTNRTISLSSGWNLIGYSSDTNVSQETSDLVNSTGAVKSWGQAVRENKVAKQFATFDNTPGVKKYKYAPLQEDKLKSKKGYFVYSKNAGNNLTIKGSGGSYKNQSYKWSDLMFTNGTDEKNITDAHNAGWIDKDNINYFLNGVWKLVDDISSEYVESWKGYVIRSNKDNIKLLRQN